MRHRLCCAALAFLSLVLSMTAQTTSGNAGGNHCCGSDDRWRTRSGSATGAVQRDFDRRRGTAPGGVVGVTFSLYAEQTGGAPLWSEVQKRAG